MSNAIVRHRIAAAQGGPTFAMQLTGPAAWAAPGGSNVASLVTSAGDLRLQASTGRVGVGMAPGAGVALDVSGSIRASSLTTSNLAVIGAIETVSAYETHSSNVVIANLGTGPALVVSQVAGAQPVATFTAGSNVALVIDNVGHVGIGTTVPRARLDVNDTGAIVLPTGTTAQQPSTPVLGMIRYNIDSNVLQYYAPQGWKTVMFQCNIATGGAVTLDIFGYRVHVFTSSGSFNVNQSVSVEYLVVAGGGGGAAQSSSNNRAAGGGGAGGMLTGTTTLTAGTIAITVGTGGSGAANSYYAVGASGNNSSIGSAVVAIGGGRGGSGTTAPATGGSGGGGGSGDPGTNGAAGTAGQGNAGGNGTSLGSSSGGGGGGAGGAGSAYINVYNATAQGGVGAASSISGQSVVYARGGDSSWFSLTSFQPRANCGDGGPAGGMDNGNGPMAGSSGVVIIRYLIQ